MTEAWLEERNYIDGWDVIYINKCYLGLLFSYAIACLEDDDHCMQKTFNIPDVNHIQPTYVCFSVKITFDRRIYRGLLSSNSLRFQIS